MEEPIYLSDIKLHVMLERNNEDSTGIVYISKDGTFGDDYIKYHYPCRDYNYIHFLTLDSMYAINQDRRIKEIKSSKIKIEDFKFAYDYLLKNGSVERNLINQHTNRCSSAIFLVFPVSLAYTTKYLSIFPSNYARFINVLSHFGHLISIFPFPLGILIFCPHDGHLYI